MTSPLTGLSDPAPRSDATGAVASSPRLTAAEPTAAPRLHALVPCAGVGARSGATIPKQYVPVAGRPMVAHTLQRLSGVARLSSIWVVLSPEDEHFDQALPAWTAPLPLRLARCGGATRAASVAAGLDALAAEDASPDDWVLVHDAARCLVQPAWIDRLIDACLDDAVGGLLALPLGDTLKAEADDRVTATIDRAHKWAAQTPQMFRLGLLREALLRAGAAVTDEASAIEALGLAPRLVPGALENFKLTWPEDFALAERLLRG